MAEAERVDMGGSGRWKIWRAKMFSEVGTDNQTGGGTFDAGNDYSHLGQFLVGTALDGFNAGGSGGTVAFKYFQQGIDGTSYRLIETTNSGAILPFVAAGITGIAANETHIPSTEAQDGGLFHAASLMLIQPIQIQVAWSGTVTGTTAVDVYSYFAEEL